MNEHLENLERFLQGEAVCTNVLHKIFRYSLDKIVELENLNEQLESKYEKLRDEYQDLDHRMKGLEK